MKTKYKNLLNLLFISFIILGFYSCSSDDDIVVEESSSLTLTETEVRVVVDKTSTIDITEGNGEYTAFSLNEDIATVELVDNKINIYALASGKTSIIVSDKNSDYKIIPILSFYDEIELRDNNIEVKKRLGHNGTKEVTIIRGNGGYKVTSENPKLVAVNIENNNIVIVGKKEGTVKISIEDQFDVQTTISVTVISTINAYEDEELEDLLKDSSQRFYFDESFSASYYKNIKTVEDEYNVYGWDYYSYGHQKVYFKGDKGVGKKAGSLFSYNDWSGIVYEKQPINFEIVKNDGTLIWAIFSFIKNEKLLYGHFVRPI